ncbi:MAG: hypothetical protein KKB00_12295 [Gammaproteobacteria bacterium]|nr:hypothetical protein [Gammaproteobacteria bacterium]
MKKMPVFVAGIFYIHGWTLYRKCQGHCVGDPSLCCCFYWGSCYLHHPQVEFSASAIDIVSHPLQPVPQILIL